MRAQIHPAIRCLVLVLASAAGRSVDGRSEWQAGLDARSSERGFPDDGPADRPTEPLRTDPQA